MARPSQYVAPWVASVFPDALFYKPTTERVVALTIDDVPTPNDPDDSATQLILDAIAVHNQTVMPPAEAVRATFFIISSHLSDDSTILERILRDGHEIGNHGVVDTTHALLSAESFEQQFREAHERLMQVSHTHHIRWYRPGRGLYNPQMREVLERMATENGYEKKLALASMVPLDTFDLTSDPKFTVQYVQQFVFPGAILVLHGGSVDRSQKTAAVLPLLLDALSSQSYQVVTLSELWDWAT